jgi:hypothetical protein
VSAIRLRPEELDLLVRMLDRRDSAHLAGVTSDVFQATELNGGTSVLFYPGHSGGEDVPSLTVSRFRSLGVFHVIKEWGEGFTFDLVDDIRDRLEQLRQAAGQPTLLGEAVAARQQAGAELTALQARVEQAAGERQAKREAFASAVGRWANRLATLVSIGLYAAATIVAMVVTTPAFGGIVGGVVLAVLAILSWRFHLDAFAAAHALERRTTRAIENWLRTFDAAEG